MIGVDFLSGARGYGAQLNIFFLFIPEVAWVGSGGAKEPCLTSLTESNSTKRNRCTYLYL